MSEANNDEMPKKLPATNWSKIHEMARKNNLLPVAAKQGGDQNQNQNQNQNQHQHQNQHHSTRTSHRLSDDHTAALINPSILRRSMNPDRTILNTNANANPNANANDRGEFTSNRRKSTTFAPVVTSRGSIGLSDESTTEKKTNYARSYRPYWGVTANTSVNSSRAGNGGLADYLPLCCRPSQQFSNIMILVARHKTWRTIVAVLEAILLVGPQIRDLACPKESDRPFDIIFIITVAGLFLDIFLMSHSIPNYFTFRIHGAQAGDENRSIISAGSSIYAQSGSCGSNAEVVDSNNQEKRWSCCCRGFRGVTFGGFIFWLDVVSASALLFDITLINPLLTKKRTIYLIHGNHRISHMVDFFCFDNYQRWYIILCVLRTPRIVRLMQASGIIDIWLRIVEIARSWIIKRKFSNLSKMDREEVPMSMSRNDSTSMKESEVDPTTNDDKPTNQTNNLNSMTAPTHIQSTKKLDKMSRFIQNRDQNPAQTTSRDSSSHTRSHRTPNGLNRNAYDYILDTRVYKKKKRGKTQVGTEMHALTVKNVALGTMIAIMLTTIFTNHERGTYMNSSMLTMHGTLTSVKNITKGDNKTDEYLNKTFNMVNLEDEFNLISYKIGNNSLLIATDDSLREREMLEIIISCDPAYVPEDEKSCVDYEVSVGVFDARFWFTQLAIYTILLLIFIMITWYIAVSSFAGPITVLIIIPIERMIKILNLLVADPFGYQRSQKYRHFIEEGEDIDICSKWKKLNLSGMETSFLMSTILRIGSLMKVGFGDAGAKIIRQSLENEKNGTGENSDRRKKTSKTNVSCIFLFCDIRRFTDATECLREEVFVFTNKIAAVVHSLCHSYGGSANKNIGDAFLISWLLEENETRAKGKGRRQNKAKTKTLVAKHDEADKALLAVLKIIIALNYESYFLDELSAGTRERLKEKFFHTEGPLVQMGFGLHAGKAVQGAIGSHRKLDATYISNAVEQAEYLESSTKKYGVKLLMSGEFYGMLTPGNRRRCRQIDQVFFRDDDGDQFEEPPNPEDYDEKMELYTYDIDVNFIFQNSNKVVKSSTSSLCGMSLIEKNSVDRGSLISTDVYQMTVAMGLSASQRAAPVHSITSQMPRDRDSRGRRWSMNIWTNLNASVNSKSMDRVLGENLCAEIENGVENVEYVEGELLLPTEKCIYKPSIWLSDDMRFVRGRYSDGQFFQEFNIGLQHYFHGEWDAARECLQAVDAKITDGPARYYLKKMQDTNYVPPRGFTGWSEA